MRILSLSNVPLEERLGSGYVILNFAKRLRGRGHHVDVVGPETLERGKFLYRGKLQRLAWGMRAYAARHAAAGQYDVVELFGGPTCRAAQMLFPIRDRNFLLVAHTNGIEMHLKEQVAAELGTERPGLMRRMKEWLELPVERAFADVDGIVTVGHFDFEYACRQRLQPDERIVAIENPLPDEFRGLNVSWERERIVGFCGGWLERKGVECLKRGLSIVLDSCPELRVRLIGVGDSFRKENHFKTAHSGRIEIVPDMAERSELRRHYQELAILIMPSFYESFGLVASEAMACGAALVAKRTGFAASLIDGEETLLLERSNGDELAGALKRLLTDEPLRQRIAKNGWERVQNLCWDNAVVALEKTYTGWLRELRCRQTGSPAGRSA